MIASLYPMEESKTNAEQTQGSITDLIGLKRVCSACGGDLDVSFRCVDCGKRSEEKEEQV